MRQRGYRLGLLRTSALVALGALSLALTAPVAPSSGTSAPGRSVAADVWTTGDKVAVGTAVESPASPLWFTAVRGGLADLLYPRVDQDNLRQFGYLVTDGSSFLFDSMKDGLAVSRVIDDRALLYQTTVSDPAHGFVLISEFAVDPARPVVLMQTQYIGPSRFHVYAYLVPHLLDSGREQTGWFAGSRAYVSRLGRWMAVGSTGSMARHSAGYLRANDGLEQLRHFDLGQRYDRAGPGRVTLTWEVPNASAWTVALGMGQSQAEADRSVTDSLQSGYAAVRAAYRDGWLRYAARLDPLGGRATALYYHSAEIIKVAEDRERPGAIVASLALPWGDATLDTPVDVGYRKVWPRDLYHAASGLLAAGDERTAIDVVHFMRSQQLADGSMPQNTDLDGRRQWTGDQLDETADAMLLAVRLAPRIAAGSGPDIAAAAAYLLRRGPLTEQERWEENSGYSPATMAAEIAALRAAARWARTQQQDAQATRWQGVADQWDAQVEGFTYVTSGPLGTGYYLRISADGHPTADDPLSIANGGGTFDQRLIVDPSFLELVRLGIRGPADPRIRSTLAVLDAVDRGDSRSGSGWYRYPHDGYGESTPGGAPDGRGHLWPLLAGERGIYAVLAGDDVAPMVRALEAWAGPEHLLSEQVWEGTGAPTGSARPLVWAHAEYIVLLRAALTGRVDDQPH
jgi:glucoamylase